MKYRNVDVKELRAALKRAEGLLSADDLALLTGVVDTFTALTRELQLNGATLARLRRLFLGSSTEKTSAVLGVDAEASDPARARAPGNDTAPKGPRRGHGKNGAAAYTGATRKQVAHPSLARGADCPGCARGHVYPLEPAQLLRVQGMAPLSATVWECDRLRCNACGEVFTAAAPEGVGVEKYDESAAGMVAMLRYGAGVPFTRIEKLQKGMGIPLPSSTQWELVERFVEGLTAVHDALTRIAAQGEVLHNDDTSMRVLELASQTPEEALVAGASKKVAARNGVRTTGIVSRVGQYSVALFMTGRQVAGEGLEELLQERLARLGPPIQMSDALLHNLPRELATIVAHCLAHARRYFVDCVESFPDECRVVLTTLSAVYQHDAEAREQSMSPEARLLMHQERSGPLMRKLKQWMRSQLDKRRVEPNSPLGEAIRYMLKHWEPLTLFLRVPGSPLDNNVCERALKKAILHRKNSLFYRTVHGALVGDLYMSLIHTAELNSVDPFPYLVALMRNATAVAEAPSDWMPWNYLARAGPGVAS